MSYNLYHYFDKNVGPFRNLSKLTTGEAEEVSNRLKLDGKTFASQRSSDYMNIRRKLEARAREQFIAKGGRPYNLFPHYMTLEPCEWISSWYKTPGEIVIPWGEFSQESVSFTYGDLFPTMRYEDDKPYRKQVFVKREIIEIIRQYGLPQKWNKNGEHGPERYIEVQVWDEEVIKRFLND